MRTNWQRLKKITADVHGEVEKEIARIVVQHKKSPQ
jgi:hypothetical protein